MKHAQIILGLVLLSPLLSSAQNSVPFKLGTFEDGAEQFLGLVLNDSVVVNIDQANDALAGQRPTMPSDMKELVVRYPELRSRLQAIAATASAEDGGQLAYVSPVDSLKILAPIIPNIMYAAGSNYSDHAAEMDGPIEGLPPRKHSRNLGTAAGRHSPEPLCLYQGSQHDHRGRGRDPYAAGAS